MPDDPIEPDPTKLTHVRVPDPLPPSEREAFEGKIKELKETIADLEQKLAAALKPKPEPKRKSMLERFNPLG